jgi:hypothetical protein
MRSWFLVPLFVVLLFLSSCRTGGVVLRETPLSASDTRRVVVTIIGQPRQMSKDGRELSSVFYDRKNNPIEKMDSARERIYTRVSILGDRRPFDIRVEVLVEGRNRMGQFEQADRDDGRAAVLAEKIKHALNQSRDSRNVIDDFRSF